MNRMIKRFFFTAIVLLLLVAALPFLFVQFASDASAASVKMLVATLIGYSYKSPSADTVEHSFNVPDGFSLDIYATDLGRIRFMHVTDQGDLLISRPRSGDILLIQRDADSDGLADGQRVLVTGLSKPHGLDIVDGWLYIAESTAVGKVRFDAQTATIEGQYQRIVEGLAGSGNHWTKTLRHGPDGWLYLTSGSSCNVCVEEDEQRATMMRFKTDGSSLEIFATGLRNTVGFDWAPWDASLYGTDNGRDLLGDDFPPCELNKIEQHGFYGWPYINGFGELDPDMNESLDREQGSNKALLARAISPVHGFRAHNAPLGITFLRHTSYPGFKKAALVALHGSWNRSTRDGYKVVSLHWQNDGTIIEKDFLTGFDKGNEVIGRPVDVVEGRDGSIYISDDYSGTIFRLRYNKQVGIAPPITKIQAKPFVDARQALAVYSEDEQLQLSTAGEKLYQQYRCGNCHDPARARPMRTIKPLENIAQRYTLNELADFFLTPTPPMPVFPLNDQQREALAVYLYRW